MVCSTLMINGAYIFLDESGDSGFKIEKGSTRFFCLAAVIVQDQAAIRMIEQAIAELRTELHLPQNYEFHFFSESAKYREAFCRKLAGCPFIIKAIMVDKTLITDSILRQKANAFYYFITRLLLQHHFETITAAKVRIDGKTNRPLKTFLRQHLSKNTVAISSIAFSDSKRDSMIQLADMVAGSIARSYQTEKKDRNTYRGLLRHRISHIWEFSEEESEVGSDKVMT